MMTAADFAGRRKALGLTQGQIAAILGYDRRHIGRYERGEADIPPVAMFAILGLEAGPVIEPHHPPLLAKIAGMQLADGLQIAVFDDAAIWGIGRSLSAALIEAYGTVYPALSYNERMAKLENMQIAPATDRLIAAVHAEGGAIAFVEKGGIIDLPD